MAPISLSREPGNVLAYPWSRINLWVWRRGWYELFVSLVLIEEIFSFFRIDDFLESLLLLIFTVRNQNNVCFKILFSNKFHVRMNFSYNSQSRFCFILLGRFIEEYESVLPRYKMKLERVVASFSWSIESNNSANVVSMRAMFDLSRHRIDSDGWLIKFKESLCRKWWAKRKLHNTFLLRCTLSEKKLLIFLRVIKLRDFLRR